MSEMSVIYNDRRSYKANRGERVSSGTDGHSGQLLKRSDLHFHHVSITYYSKEGGFHHG